MNTAALPEFCNTCRMLSNGKRRPCPAAVQQLNGPEPGIAATALRHGGSGH
jgi:hypothetical protein